MSTRRRFRFSWTTATGWKRGLPLALVAFFAACGTGISVDLSATARPGGNGQNDDGGGQLSAGDGSSNDATDATDAQSDVRSATEGGADADRAADGSAPDRSDAGDAAIEVVRDGSGDGSSETPDLSIDVTNDANTDVSTDGLTDVGRVDDAGGDPTDTSDTPGNAADGSRESDSAGAADGCTIGCTPDTDYYVDANAPLGGNGSKENPFRTITAAIDAHTRAPARARTAHVAAGTYDEALGEVFPLVLRGLSLEGAGSDQTSIVGGGALNHSAAGGPKFLVYQVTIVAGDRALPTNVSGFAVHPVGPVPSWDAFGVFCDRGNATGEISSPGGLTHLDKLEIGPGYDTSVMVTTTTVPSASGCNMRITRSTITGGWTGVNTIGCDDNIPPVPVMLELGTDDPESGNTLSWMVTQDDQGEGLLAQSCTVRASVQYNTFSDSVDGVTITEFMVGPDPNGPRHPFIFKHNRFERNLFRGIYEWGTLVFIEELSDNVFSGNSVALNQHIDYAIGLDVQSNNIGKARRNVFVGNDVGMSLGAPDADFGRPDDPGLNAFYCNSSVNGSFGADLGLSGPPETPADGGPPRLMRFAGNSFDHLPPRLMTDGSPPNGVEITTPANPLPNAGVDLSHSSLITAGCPSGRIP